MSMKYGKGSGSEKVSIKSAPSQEMSSGKSVGCAVNQHGKLDRHSLQHSSYEKITGGESTPLNAKVGKGKFVAA